MNGLLHQVKTRPPVIAGRLSEVGIQIAFFLDLVVDTEVSRLGQIDVRIIEKGRFPIHQPEALPVKDHILRFQIIMACYQLSLVARVHLEQMA